MPRSTTIEKSPSRYRQFRKTMKELSGSYVKIGLFGGKLPGAASVVRYGAVHEFGTDKAGVSRTIRIPERSFIRANDDINRSVYRALQVKGLRMIVRGAATPTDVLMALGARIQADIKRRITAGIPPELAESTKAAKAARNQSPTPLIRFGTLRRYVTFAVYLKGRERYFAGASGPGGAPKAAGGRRGGKRGKR